MSRSLYTEAANTEKELAEAEDRLAKFDARMERQNKMARFRAESPRHPILVGMGLSMLCTLALGFFGVILALAPLLSASLARTYVANPAMAILPPGVIGLAVCSAVLWVGLRLLASARAAQSPLMPRNLAERNRLVADVQRLKAQQSVSKRLSATPAPARMRSY